MVERPARGGGGMEAPPVAGTACDRAWQDGTDVARVASACAGMSILATSAKNLLVDDIAGYRAILPMETPLSVALRPMPPDCFAAADLVSKLRALDDAEVAWADFYHYGFMRLSNPPDGAPGRPRHDPAGAILVRRYADAGHRRCQRHRPRHRRTGGGGGRGSSQP